MNNDTNNPFRAEFGDIKPLDQDKITTRPKTDSAINTEARREAAIKLYRDRNFLVDTPVPSVEPEELLSFKLDGVQSGVFKKLRQGKYTVEGHLDLHRHTVAEARSALFQFIQQSLRLNCRTLLVTHGKGARSNPPARIKSYVYYWLQQFQEVLAFHSSIPKDGGTGAVYVLLRKTNEKKIENRERFS